MSEPIAESVGVVVIGRNEGERLQRCLASVVGQACAVVYVDSGSTDGSLVLASRMGASIVALDLAQPFTAARARNAGLRALLAAAPGISYVQFVDGDCEVRPSWIAEAMDWLAGHPGHAVACGRRRERHPEKSVFNRLCDLEWDTPVGETSACGGDALVRVSALQQVGGFRDDLIAGEEPELCLRLRAAGWRVRRLALEMTLHDAAITRFGQWWRRSVRAGHAFAEGAWIHGAVPHRHWVRETIRALAFGLLLPLLAVIVSFASIGWSLVLLAVYPLQVLRVWARTGDLPHAFYLLLSKFPECEGVLRFYGRVLRSGSRTLIEYK